MESESIQQVIEHTSSRPQAPIAQATTSPDVLALEPIQVTAIPISSAQLVQEAIVVGHTMDISAQLVWEGKFSLWPRKLPLNLYRCKVELSGHPQPGGSDEEITVH